MQLYRRALIDDYLGFVAWVEKVVSNQDFKKEAIGNPEDNVGAIGGESTFELAYKDYYACIDNIKFWLTTYYVWDGIGRLNDIYSDNENKLSGEALANFKAKHDECVSKMEKIRCDLDELDNTVNAIVNELETYLAQLLN